MGLAYIRNMEVDGAPFVLNEVIGMSIVGGVPPRPQPRPPIDPDAPRPTHPIALPGDPWWGTFPIPPNQPPVGHVAIIKPLGEGDTPPATPSPDAVWVKLAIHRGAPDAFALVQPHVMPHPGV